MKLVIIMLGLLTSQTCIKLDLVQTPATILIYLLHHELAQVVG